MTPPAEPLSGLQYASLWRPDLGMKVMADKRDSHVTKEDRAGQPGSTEQRALMTLGRVRLGLFLNLPLHEVDGQYLALYPHLFDFFLALGSRTAGTALILPLKHGGEVEPGYGPVVLPPQIEVIGLPYWNSAPMIVRRAPSVLTSALWLSARLRRFDLVGAVTPSLVGGIVIGAARLWRRPTFMLVRGEKQRTVRFMLGRRRALPYVAALKIMEAPVRWWIRRGVPTFVAGRELVDRYATSGARVHDLYPALSRAFPLVSQPRTEPPQESPRVVTVARLSPEKGLDDLIRALAILRERGVRIDLDVVGDGPERRPLEQLAEQLGVSDRAHFVGFLGHGPDMLSRLDGADIFVLPSRSEGLPHSVVEGMARALPVIATAIGGIPALLAGGRGVIVPVNDPAALAGAVESLIRDPAMWRSLSERSLEIARRLQPKAQLELLAAHLHEAYPRL